MSQNRLHQRDPDARLRNAAARLASALGVAPDTLSAALSGQFAADVAKSAQATTAPANRRERRIKRALPSRDRSPTDRRYLNKLEREGRRVEAWRARQTERMAAFGSTRERAGWSRDTWIIARAVLADESGAQARAELRRLRRRWPAFAGAVAEAALGVNEHGACRREWMHPRARGIAALAIAMVLQSKRCRRKDLYQRYLAGITIGSMRALLESPFRPGRRLHRNTIQGRRDRNATIHNGGLGYLHALRATNAIFSQQLPADKVEPYERWKVERVDRATGEVVIEERASNRYWLAGGPTDNGHMSERVRARAIELAELAQAIDRPIVLLPLRRLQLQHAPAPSPAPD